MVWSESVLKTLLLMLHVSHLCLSSTICFVVLRTRYYCLLLKEHAAPGHWWRSDRSSLSVLIFTFCVFGFRFSSFETSWLTINIRHYHHRKWKWKCVNSSIIFGWARSLQFLASPEWARLLAQILYKMKIKHLKHVLLITTFTKWSITCSC